MQNKLTSVGILSLVSALAIAASLFVLTLSFNSIASAQTVVPVAWFNSIELHSGGHVVVRYGATRRVTFIKGSLEYSKVSIEDGSKLVLERCNDKCPDEYDVEIEIVTPEIASIMVKHGGTIETQGSFPQAAIHAAVWHGGTIDIRRMAVDRVSASIQQGGRILTMPRTVLSARVNNGGAIMYWGEARVEKSVIRRGVICKGEPEEANRPLAELGSTPPAVPPVTTPPRIRNDR